MKVFWAWSAKLLFVLLLIAGWMLYQKHNAYEALLANNLLLDAQLKQTQEDLAHVYEENTALEKKTVEGLLRETNKVVVSGWETLLNSVENELNQARKRIEQEADDEKNNKNNVPAPEEGSMPAVPDNESSIIDGERT